MQVDNPTDDMDRSKPQILEFRRPTPDAVSGDAEQTPALYLTRAEGENRLATIRARVLAGAYDSLDMAEQVARAILRGGDFQSAWYE